ncbi:hypothetical protein BRAS3843_2120001 [Bradyrhizobium sp. STM 3843]|uniref:hypothetical protein n=1 Tax=Bradyrhizobium sp. STM 3843 TaxID=551947 RepID=UPI00024077E9|nr:hypothetical protein [Bradyrhizobium sp. STM 3843]CCE07434.1 hypothetical protein BRAS3843_2120001 [Bradyrhizobium sp. STM 3843]
MNVYTLPDGSTVSETDQFQIGDQKYPAGWLLSASAADIAAVGITMQMLPDPPPPAVTVVSSLQFRQLFTSAERVAITQAGETNPEIRAFMDDESAAGIVHLDDPEVTSGLATCVTLALLTQDRMNAILSGTPPGPSSQP